MAIRYSVKVITYLVYCTDPSDADDLSFSELFAEERSCSNSVKRSEIVKLDNDRYHFVSRLEEDPLTNYNGKSMVSIKIAHNFF